MGYMHIYGGSKLNNSTVKAPACARLVLFPTNSSFFTINNFRSTCAMVQGSQLGIIARWIIGIRPLAVKIYGKRTN